MTSQAQGAAGAGRKTVNGLTRAQMEPHIASLSQWLIERGGLGSWAADIAARRLLLHKDSPLCLKPAPDSTRTGPVGTVAVPVEPTPEMLKAYWQQTGESHEMRTRTEASGKARYAAMIAARPAAPEAQGAWLPMSEVPKDGTHIIAHDEHYGVCEAVWRSAFDDLAEEPFEGLWDLNHSALNEATGWQPMPAPPASSGQEG